MAKYTVITTSTVTVEFSGHSNGLASPHEGPDFERFATTLLQVAKLQGIQPEVTRTLKITNDE